MYIHSCFFVCAAADSGVRRRPRLKTSVPTRASDCEAFGEHPGVPGGGAHWVQGDPMGGVH